MTVVWETVFQMRGFIYFTMMITIVVGTSLFIHASSTSWKKKTMKSVGLFLDLSTRGVLLVTAVWVQFCLVSYMLVFGKEPNKYYSTALLAIFLIICSLYGSWKEVISHLFNQLLLISALTTEYIVCGYMRDVHFEWPIVIMASCLGIFILACNIYFLLKDLYGLSDERWKVKREFTQKNSKSTQAKI